MRICVFLGHQALSFSARSSCPCPADRPLLPCSNVLLGDDGRILLTDAGLSALLGSSAPAPGVQAATLQAHVGRATPAAHAALASDVCSLGELLATLLAPQPGAPPDCPAVRGVPAAAALPLVWQLRAGSVTAL